MSSYAGACVVCTAVCVHAARHPSVRRVAEADWAQIRHCSRCGAWWDMQPANRPAVITRDEAARRVPDAYPDTNRDETSRNFGRRRHTQRAWKQRHGYVR